MIPIITYYVLMLIILLSVFRKIGLWLKAPSLSAEIVGYKYSKRSLFKRIFSIYVEFDTVLKCPDNEEIGNIVLKNKLVRATAGHQIKIKLDRVTKKIVPLCLWIEMACIFAAHMTLFAAIELTSQTASLYSLNNKFTSISLLFLVGAQATYEFELFNMNRKSYAQKNTKSTGFSFRRISKIEFENLSSKNMISYEEVSEIIQYKWMKNTAGAFLLYGIIVSTYLLSFVLLFELYS